MNIACTLMIVGLVALSGKTAWAFSTDPVLRGSSHEVRISEVYFQADPKSEADFESFQWVELYNKGSEAAELTGWTLTNAAETWSVTLPRVSIPAAAYLVIALSAGTNDLDFSDGGGVMYVPTSPAGFAPEIDDIGIDTGRPDIIAITPDNSRDVREHNGDSK